MNFGATDKSVRLLEEHHVCKLSKLIRKTQQSLPPPQSHLAAASLDLLLGRILSKNGPCAASFNEKSSQQFAIPKNPPKPTTEPMAR